MCDAILNLKWDGITKLETDSDDVIDRSYCKVKTSLQFQIFFSATFSH